MIYDIKQIKEFYASYQEKVGRVRALLARPLTYAEKKFCGGEWRQKRVANLENFRLEQMGLLLCT